MTEPPAPEGRPRLQDILGTEAAEAGPLRRRKLAWGAVILAVVLSVAAFWWTSAANDGVRYVTEPLTRGGLTVVVTATGSVQPTNKIEVSSELSGTVRRVLVDFNSVVVAGQTLAELDTDKLKATVDSSRAKLAAATARVAEAEATLLERKQDIERKRALIDTEAISAQTLQQSQAAYNRAVAGLASARADVRVAEAELKLNETNLAKACICSPINGVVLMRNVDPGQTVASTLQAPVLFSIAEDLKQMELQVDVDEADVGKVKAGQTATFMVDAFPERRFPATIRDIRYASETISGVVTYKAILDIDNSELLLRPGMTATAEIKVTEIRDALLVPNTALRYSPHTPDSGDSRSLLSRILPRGPGGIFRPASRQEEAGRNRTVWTLTDGKPAPVRIEIGATDGRQTEIRGGAEGAVLQAGQQVIVDEDSGE